jgi:hypothetical protein
VKLGDYCWLGIIVGWGLLLKNLLYLLDFSISWYESIIFDEN